VSGAATTKSAIDYAALAAKYASPSPAPTATPVPVAPGATAATARPTVVTPSSTTYGVVNAGKPASAAPAAAPVKTGSPLTKVLLFVGIPIFLIAYTFVWIIVFHVDLTKLLKF
jgi:hypothetical protein